MLGKWLEDGKSYIKVAEHYKASYYETNTWRQLSNQLNRDPDLLWELNKEFLKQQLRAGKRIIISHDPETATSFFKREIEYLKDAGYTFVKRDWVWDAVLK